MKTPFLLLLLLAQVASTAAQTPTPQAPPRPAAALTVEEATMLTQGWAFIAQGDLARAVDKASAALAANPRSVASLALAIEVEILRGGAAAGVDFYDRWIGTRTIEEPSVLRRVAVAVLREFGSDAANPTIRTEALQALAAEGDTWAAAELVVLSDKGNRGDLLALAALGSDRAVTQLVETMTKAPVPAPAALEAIGRSKSPQGPAAVRRYLTHQRPDVRASAIRALASLDSKSDIAAIKTALKDPNAYVQMTAAAALLQLGDRAGLEPMLEAAKAGTEETRLAAAEGLSYWPGADWQAIVRPLISAKDPLVRAGAAKLIAAEDPALARTTFESLQGTDNPAVREQVYRLWSEAPIQATDLRSARIQLRHPERFARFSGARVILALTR